MLNLNHLPRVPLAHLPTPLEPLPRLSALLGGPEIWIKRDDCTGLAVGGNKTRKLEYLMGDATSRMADCVLTVGALQSNHVRQTAAAAARLGLACELVLTDKVPYQGGAYRSSGNLLLDDLLGARVHVVASREAADARVAEIADRLRGEGQSLYKIPLGGSNWIGALGYVHCANELDQQSRERDVAFDFIVHASSSAGTQSGLLAGLRALGSRTRVIGVNVDSADDSVLRGEIEALTAELGARLGKHLDAKRPPADWIRIDNRYAGPGYGLPTEQMIEAVRLTASHEGVLLDPVYTGKAMAALIGMIRAGEFSARQRVLFLHTGGSPGLFAYTEALREGV